MKSFNKVALVVVATMALAACDGGGGSDSDSGSGNVPVNNYVSGTFSHIDSSPELYVSDSFSSFEMNYGCNVSDAGRFFEADKVVVAGNAELSDDDFKYAATIVQNNLSQAITKMGYSESEYNDEKRVYFPRYYETFFGSLIVDSSFFDGDYQTTNPKLAAFFVTAFGSIEDAKLFYAENPSVEKLTSFMTGHFSSVSDAAIIALNKEISEESSDTYGTYGTYDAKERMSKVLVCLEEGRTSDNWGEGTYSGMKIAAKSRASRGDAVDIVAHELIHHIQNTFSDQFGELSPVDRWFREGQAVYLSGMAITTGNHSRNPVVIKSLEDESNNYSDTSVAYKDYGQAYKYLETTYGSGKLKELIDQIQVNKEHVRAELGGAGFNYPLFDAKFSELLTDIDDFRLNYPNLNK